MNDLRPDLTTCDREPIRIPGSIQPHGVLFVLSAGRTVEAISANAAALTGRSAGEALGLSLEALVPDLDPELLDALTGPLPVDRTQPLGSLRRGAVRYDAMAHAVGPHVVLELEEVPPGQADSRQIQALIGGVVTHLQSVRTVAEGLQAVARTVRELSGFDRVMIYRFDASWTGTVIAEDRNDALPSYLELRFPASDIPQQARDLYRLNRVRQIPDASYSPVPIATRLGGPIDLGFSALRSVSPVHVEYMNNMGTQASMSVSILIEGELWGLISCHNKLAKRVPPEARSACDLVAQILSMRIASEAVHGDAAERVAKQGALTRLLAAMAASPNYAAGLATLPDALLALTGAEGAAISHEGRVTLIGRTPDVASVRAIIGWLQGDGDQGVFATASLPAVMPAAADFADAASGLLALSLSQVRSTHVLWFRSEVIHTVSWGGDPRKQFEAIGPDTRISPRKSFEAWRETVRRTSRPWSPAEVDAADNLRRAIVEILLKRAEEMASLTEDLQRSNRELEAFSYSISHDLRAPFRHIVGYAELLSERYGEQFDEKARHFLHNITESAHTAGKLVDDLLHFSQLGRVQVHPVRVDMNKLMSEVIRSLAFETRDREIEWHISDLPPATGDAGLIRQVLFNLVSNAVKYTRGRTPALILVSGRVAETPGGRETAYTVSDNGIGFDMAYVDKLFQVFQRLNRSEDFEGTGIGLALVRRIVERHGGRTEAIGEIGRGATFTFALPERAAERI
ncbi:ATP-binding protein [Chthonobacter albigriseus]|uniref:ATP-binding protein n=1 Tax=Chthonobacter albigriseus TaxID=1683161 RepID=UPI0015EF0BCB|nr:ATP-binding protein [Chthonobacter albigriseus]